VGPRFKLDGGPDVIGPQHSPPRRGAP
jgi:hypothetical protein